MLSNQLLLLRKSTRIWRRGHGFLNRNVVAKTLEPADKVGADALFVDVVEIGGAEVAVVLARLEHVVGGDQDAVRDGHGGSLVAAPSLEPMELVAQVGALGQARGVGSLDENIAQMNVASARPGAT